MIYDYAKYARMRANKGNPANTNPNAGLTSTRTPTTRTYGKRPKRGVYARGGGDIRREVAARGGPTPYTGKKYPKPTGVGTGITYTRPTPSSSPVNLPGRRTVEVSEPSWLFGWKNVPTWAAKPQDTHKVSGDGTIKIYRDTEGGSWASNVGDTYHVHPDGSVLVRRTGGKLQYYKDGFAPKGAYGITVKEMPKKFS